MVELRPDNLRQIVADLKREVGNNFIESLANTYKNKVRVSLAEHELICARAHPLGIQWHALQQEIAETECTGAFKLSQESTFLLDLLCRLSSLKKMEGFPTLLQKLGIKGQFRSTSYEAHVLSDYLLRDEIISMLPEDRHRTADFVVTKGGSKVFIECKSMEDLSRKEDRICAQVTGALVRLLETHKRPWRVVLRPQRYLRGNDIRILRDFIGSKVAANSTGAYFIDKIHVELISICLPGVWYAGPLALPKEGSNGVVEAEFMRTQNGELFRNPVAIDIVQFFEEDEWTRVSRLVSEAALQIPINSCGLVHIEIPHRDPRRLIKVTDNVFDRVQAQILNKPNVGAVIICGRCLDLDMKNGDDPIFSHMCVVPNPRCIPLPNDFVVPGCDCWTPVADVEINDEQKGSFESFNIDPEGRVLLGFEINEELRNQTGRTIFKWCSKHGERQLHIWQSLEDLFRVDVIHPSFGRKVFCADLDDLAVGVEHKFATTWDSEGLRASLNGNTLNQHSASSSDPPTMGG